VEIEENSQANLGEMLRSVAGILLRHKWWILLFLTLGSVSSFVVFRYLPKTYVSTALVLVEAQKVPKEYVQAAVAGSVEDRLSSIKQQILSRSLLKGLIDKFGLYKEEAETMGSESIINKIRSSIVIDTLGKKNIDAFSLSFKGDNPNIVMNVTNALASAFIEENLKVREQLVEGTSDFLDSELRQLQSILEQQEAKIGAYKQLHRGELPQQTEANLRAIDRLQADMHAIALSRRAVEDRIMVLENTLSAAKQQIESAALSSYPLGALPSSAHSSPLLQRLAEKKGLLVHLQGEYKETYPDIISLKLEIANLEKELLLSQTENAADVAEPGVVALPIQEPPFMLDIRTKILEAQLEIRRLNDRETGIPQQIALISARLENIPLREQELVTLTRDYENTKRNYEALLAKKLNARIAENLEKRQKGEQFRILDAASLPDKPTHPDPWLFGLAGPLVGLALGVGMAFLREMLHVLIRGPEAIERLVRLPVLVTIPDFHDEVRYEARRVADSLALAGKTGRGDRE